MKFGNLTLIRSVIWLFSANLLYLLLLQMPRFCFCVPFACWLYRCWVFHITSLSKMISLFFGIRLIVILERNGLCHLQTEHRFHKN